MSNFDSPELIFSSIIIVGVGDGPWDVMEKFDDEIPQRKFDNLQFVQFYGMKQYTSNFDVNFRYEESINLSDVSASML